MHLERFWEVGELERRSGQLVLSQEVKKALVERSVLIAEGGTGVGKTFAYLVPLVEWLLENPEKRRAVISTSTIFLQQQLLTKDIPFVLDVYKKERGGMPFDIGDVKLLVGSRNYLCEHDPVFSGGSGRRSELIASALNDEVRFVLNELAAHARKAGVPLMRQSIFLDIPDAVWNEICCSGLSSCKCGEAVRCGYRNYISELKQSGFQILLVNHHLLLSRLKLPDSVCSKGKEVAFVCDEAHGLLQLGGALESFNLTAYREMLTKIANEFQGRWIPDWDPLEVWQACGRLAEAERRIMEAMEKQGVYAARLSEVGIESKSVVFPRLFQSMSFLPRLRKGLLNLAGSIGSQGSEGVVDLILRAASLTERLLELRKQQVDLAYTGAKSVWWFERGKASLYLCSAPLDPKEMQRFLSSRTFLRWSKHWKAPLIFVSATITLPSKNRNAGFVHFVKSFQLDKTGRRISTVSVPSPFDYKKCSLLLIPTDLPVPAEDSEQSWMPYYQAVAESLREVIPNVVGNCVILCTSVWQCEFFTHFLKKELRDVSIFSQTEGVTLLRAAEALREGAVPQKVLVGLESAWQGLDLPGEALRGLFIIKVPFMSPDHPLVHERKRLWKEVYGTSYFMTMLEEALMLLKQGSGRLIRTNSPDEYGLVVFYDPRFSAERPKPYLTRVLGVFPEGMPCRLISKQELPHAVREFFALRQEQSSAIHPAVSIY